MALAPAGSNPLLLSLLLLFSVTCSYGNQNQQFINSCGDIHNISFPFQLQGDPSITCNDNNFTLSCDENNRTVLPLLSGKYYVKSINYTTQSIHLVDVGFQSNDICSSFPPSSLTPSDLFDGSPYRMWDVSSVVFLSCENPVQYPSIYINKTGYCNSTRDNSGNGYYSYAVAGDVSIGDIADSCFLEAFYLSSSPLVKERGSNLSWLDLNNVLEYGFEASWYTDLCSSMCRERASCFGDSVNVTAVCSNYEDCRPVICSVDGYCRPVPVPVPDSCPVIFFFFDRCSIHLVDVGLIQTNDICSPFPLSSSTFLYFTHGEGPYYAQALSSVAFLGCENPVQSPIYINTTGYNCNSTTGDDPGKVYYSYAVAGNVSVWDVADSCVLEASYLSSSQLIGEGGSNLSWLDFNKELGYGFQASWGTSRFFCSSMCRKKASCFGDSVNVTAVCDQYCVLDSCHVIFFFIDECSLSEIF